MDLRMLQLFKYYGGSSLSSPRDATRFTDHLSAMKAETDQAVTKLQSKSNAFSSEMRLMFSTRW
jgi:hypothetical protein